MDLLKRNTYLPCDLAILCIPNSTSCTFLPKDIEKNVLSGAVIVQKKKLLKTTQMAVNSRMKK